MDSDILNPVHSDEKNLHKKKRLITAQNSYFMDVRCSNCGTISTVFSHTQTTFVCMYILITIQIFFKQFVFFFVPNRLKSTVAELFLLPPLAENLKFYPDMPSRSRIEDGDDNLKNKYKICNYPLGRCQNLIRQIYRISTYKQRT